MDLRIVLLLSVLGLLALPNRSLSGTLPAYAHNDYWNEHPLWDALERGYEGVEVDLYLIGGQLRLGHDREEAAKGSSFEGRYLHPLSDRVDQLGSVHGDGRRFLLNIELKEQDMSAFTELQRLLSKYSNIFTGVVAGIKRSGPIQAVLVGWHPTVEQLLAQPVRYFGIQQRPGSLGVCSRDCPADLCKMISFEFRELSRWSGVGRPPRRFGERMRRFRIERQKTPNRIVRVFNVPRSKAVYGELLASGVDYIGTKTIEDTRLLLERIGVAEPGFTWGR